MLGTTSPTDLTTGPLEFEVRAVLDLNYVIYRTYATLAEALAVVGVYRADGFKAWTYPAAEGTGRNAIRNGSAYHELERR